MPDAEPKATGTRRRLASLVIAPAVVAACALFMAWLGSGDAWWATTAVAVALAVLPPVVGSRRVVRAQPALVRGYFVAAGVGSAVVAVAALAGAVVFALAAATSGSSDGWGDLIRALGIMMSVMCALVAAAAGFATAAGFALAQRVSRGEY